jgi:hypothetical protein
VHALGDLQAEVRRALLTSEGATLEPLLVGGSDPVKRLAIHQRHYATSLVTALLERFPATVWLAGSSRVTDAAREFVQHHPPARPCIAEYGEDFPAFLTARNDAAGIPYIGQFAELEWHLGRLSLAVDVAGIRPADLSGLDADRLMGARLTFQPGIHYLKADWAIDQLMALYLTDSAPERFILQSGAIWLELRGARGELRINRLTHADFVFRLALAAGDVVADAAASVLDVDAAFDPGRALLTLLNEGAIATVMCDGQKVGYG